MSIPSRVTSAMIRRSHERQFAGEDYQAVAVDLWNEIGPDATEDEYNQLAEGPDPDCNCGFCKSAPWHD